VHNNLIPVVLYVPHKGPADEHPKPKMVGKILPNGVFYHEALPFQFHIKTKCSFPIDTIVVKYLENNNIEMVHCKTRNRVMKAHVTRIKEAPVFNWGGRLRHYLPDSDWGQVTDKYDIPWIEKELVIEEEI
jgi:hypothetical protein